MDDIILVGYGGHGKSVADCIERQGKYNIVGYTDFERHESSYKYLGSDEVLEKYFKLGITNAVIGIGYIGKGNIRERVFYQLKKIGYKLPIIIDPSAIVSANVKIGEGSFVGKGAIINTETKIGKAVIVNTKALIEHECEINDFAHVAVGAVTCGQVKIGVGAFVGANSTIIQCKKIDDYVTVPAGVTVRGDEKNINKMTINRNV